MQVSKLFSNYEIVNWVLLLFIPHVNVEHFGKYTSFSNSKAEKNKLSFKSYISTKTKLLKLVLLKFVFRYLISIHVWSNIEKQRLSVDLKSVNLTDQSPNIHLLWEFYLNTKRCKTICIILGTDIRIYWKHHLSMTMYGSVSRGPPSILTIILEKICSIYYYNLFLFPYGNIRMLNLVSGFLFTLMNQC